MVWCGAYDDVSLSCVNLPANRVPEVADIVLYHRWQLVSWSVVLSYAKERAALDVEVVVLLVPGLAHLGEYLRHPLLQPVVGSDAPRIRQRGRRDVAVHAAKDDRVAITEVRLAVQAGNLLLSDLDVSAFAIGTKLGYLLTGAALGADVGLEVFAGKRVIDLFRGVGDVSCHTAFALGLQDGFDDRDHRGPTLSGQSHAIHRLGGLAKDARLAGPPLLDVLHQLGQASSRPGPHH